MGKKRSFNDLIDNKRFKKYLETKGFSYVKVDWTVDELIELLNNNDIKFEGEETGGLYFGKTNSGKRYIKFMPSICLIDVDKGGR